MNGTIIGLISRDAICNKLRITSPGFCCLASKTVTYLVLIGLGFCIGCIIIPLLCCLCGFRFVGVRGNSPAAMYQSVHGTPVCFSCLQSVSMKGHYVWVIPLLISMLAGILVFSYGRSCFTSWISSINLQWASKLEKNFAQRCMYSVK